MAASALSVTSIDLHKEYNRENHHTDEYEKEELIVRRGQAFKLSIKFDRPIKDTDTVILQFTTGEKPKVKKGNTALVRLLSKKKKKRTHARAWTVEDVNIASDTVTGSVVSFSGCVVGRYKLFVVTKSKRKGKERHACGEAISVLFNPWCKDDPVYMEDETGREEYVLMDYGRIWVGSASNNRGRPWNFGQFDSPCLDAALHLLEKAGLKDDARGNTVAVLRAISALTNDLDDRGVLAGRWQEPYTNGTVPWGWTGSVAIIKQYMDTGKPVKYGQCWVFSGIVTTLLRALGIPTRSVTNFESAHDTENSMTIDYHWDENFELESKESTWNFHVWNEAWLRRLDLPEGYDGWQAVDGTPQERSDGIFRCGPASVKAIKEGHVYLSYDAPFIFGEVNGDQVHWQDDDEGFPEVIKIDTQAVGKNISTKAIGSSAREDITDHYKYPEGSEKEREVVEFVNQFSWKKNIYKTDTSTDVEVKLQVPETGSLSEDIKVTMVMKNTSDESRTVNGRMSVFTSSYTGVPDKRLGDEVVDVTIQAKQQEKVVVSITTKQFQDKLNAEANFYAIASFKVEETNQRWADTKGFNLVMPDLLIELPDDMRVKQSYTGTVTFTNPLDIKLTGSSLQVEGGNAVGTQSYKHKKPVKPGETISFEFEINPRRRGKREVEASFSSDQLSGVDGSAEFTVK